MEFLTLVVLFVVAAVVLLACKVIRRPRPVVQSANFVSSTPTTAEIDPVELMLQLAAEFVPEATPGPCREAQPVVVGLGRATRIAQRRRRWLVRHRHQLRRLASATRIVRKVAGRPWARQA